MWVPEDANLELPIIEKIEDPEQLLAQIIECIQQRDSRGVKTYILEHKLKNETIFWELILKLGDCITSELCENDPVFFDTCSRCLLYLIKVGNPKETLLALLEQVDTFIDDVKFKNFLLFIQTALLKIPTKLFHSLDITLESVSSHLRSLPMPENTQLEGDEIKVFHMDKTVARLADILQAYLTFLEPFVNAVDLNLPFESWTKACKQEALVLKKHLVRLLDLPLCHLILTYNPESDRAKSDSRISAELAMTLLSKLETDFHRLMRNAKVQVGDVVDADGDQAEGPAVDTELGQEEYDNQENERKLASETGDTSDIVESWDFKMEISPLAQACLAYLLHAEHLGIEKLPKVYRHDYMLEFHLDLSSLLLQNTNFPINYKGLLLIQSLVGLVPHHSLSADCLDNPKHMQVINDLIHVMIKCPVRDHRTLATKIFPNFITKFDASGRYQIYLGILSSCDHSGLKGYLTTLLKNDLNDYIKVAKSTENQQEAARNISDSSDQPNKKREVDISAECFTGKKLYRVLKIALHLPERETSDMLENSDQIISSLNLLRYLILADPASSNVTGVWEFMPFIEKDFISPLRLGLDMSKAHYQLELDNMRQGKDSLMGAGKGPEISVSLPGVPSGRCISLRTLVTSPCYRRSVDQGTTSHSQQEQQSSTEGPSSETQSSTQGQTEENEYEHSVKTRILKASLSHVLEHGWTQKALEAGARDEGLPPIAHGMFPRGGAELVHYFYAKCNSDLAEILSKEVEKAKAEGLEKPKPKPLIRDAVETRLRMVIPYLDQWPQAMAIQALPQNAPEALRNLMNMVDEIWYHAGDRSVDYNWYTKRMALAGVYKTTEIYMLQDKSPDKQDTWAFLDRRLGDLQTFGAAKKSCEQSGDVLREAMTGFFIMGRNMLGMNSRNR